MISSTKPKLNIHMEHHPRINISKFPLKEPRIILGSFPTWSLSFPDSPQKENERIKNKEMFFFYGSYKNRFWNWYHKFVDHNVSKKNIDLIQESMRENCIGITDMIVQCVRHKKSALDKDLRFREYNFEFIHLPKKNETLKILCTSKGVMNQMLLSKSFFKLFPTAFINKKESEIFEKQFIQKISGNLQNIKNPFFRLIEIENGGNIECLALPSPGSPFRRLIDFGFDDIDSKRYLDEYLSHAFNWFLAKYK